VFSLSDDAAKAVVAIEAQPKRSLFVFSTESGLPLSPRNVCQDIKARKKALGLPDNMRLHELRGTFVSLLLESGVDLRTVQELARHSDPRTTQAMYARSRTETKVAAIERLKSSVTPISDPATKAKTG